LSRAVRKGAAGTACLFCCALLAAGCNGPERLHPAHQILQAPAETISIYQLAGRLKLRLAEQSEHRATLRDSANAVTIFADPGGAVFLNGARLAHHGPIVKVNGMLFVPGSIAPTIRPLLRPARPGIARRRPPPVKRPSLGTVVLDPGHGGRDPGAIGCNGMFEKECVLAVALLVRRQLSVSNVKVIMTRRDDRFISLERRAEIANQAGPDLFVSIHADSAPSRAAHGHTLYLAGGASGESKALARCIDRRLTEKRISSRGVRRANFRVLVQTTCPAVLVEIGYLSNDSEARRLATGGHRQDVADAIAGGIIDALRQ